MGVKIRAALLLCLAAAAVMSVTAAYRSMHRGARYELPEEIMARFSGNKQEAEYILREKGGYIAVFASSRDREPVSVTGIETEGLRNADKALLSDGIPVSDRRELLELLEDLGS